MTLSIAICVNFVNIFIFLYAPKLTLFRAQASFTFTDYNFKWIDKNKIPAPNTQIIFKKIIFHIYLDDPMHYAQQTQTLFVVTKPSLQAKALVRLMSTSLPVTVLLHDIANPFIEPPENALVLYDITSSNDKNDIRWQHFLKNINTSFKLLLIGQSEFEKKERIFKWPCVQGFFCISDDHHQLINGIKKVLRNELHLPDSLIKQYAEGNKKAQAGDILTEREKMILMALREGASNNQMADSLFISKFTVKAHLYNIFKKIDVKNRTQAVNWVNENLCD